MSNASTHTLHLLNIAQQHYQPCIPAFEHDTQTTTALHRQSRLRSQHPLNASQQFFHPDVRRTPTHTQLTIRPPNGPPPRPIVHNIPKILTDPFQHPNFRQYSPPADPPAVVHARIRGAHATTTSPLTYQPLREQSFFTLQRYEKGRHQDLIVISFATMTGSHLAAYARDRIYPHDVIAHYDAPKPSPSNLVLPHESPANTDYALLRTHTRTGKQIQANAFYASSCQARYIDEALTEDEENCTFELLGNRLIVRATKQLQPGDQLLTRYGHEYWLERALKLPLILIQQMYDKYKHTLTTHDPTAHHK